MTRAQRVRIVASIALALFGLIVAFFGQAVVAVTLFPDLSPSSFDDVGSLVADIDNASTIGNLLMVGGLVTAGCGFLYCSITWARWFIGRSDASSNA